jgi:Cu/Ag efflux protein CusF
MGLALLISVLAASAWSCRIEPPVRRYHVRGIVREVSGKGDELRVTIHHERVLGFEDRDGDRSDMASMKMNFGVTKAVPEASLAPGQKLAFDFDVRWNETPTLLLVRAQTLPPDTPLTLSDDHAH